MINFQELEKVAEFKNGDLQFISDGKGREDMSSRTPSAYYDLECSISHIIIHLSVPVCPDLPVCRHVHPHRVAPLPLPLPESAFAPSCLWRG